MALAVISFEHVFLSATVPDIADLFGNVHAVVDTGIEAQSAQRIVQMRGIARQEDTFDQEPVRHPLVHRIEIAVKHVTMIHVGSKAADALGNAGVR